MTTVRSKLARAKDALVALGFPRPRVGFVLGSGLGSFADTIGQARTAAYERVDGMPEASVAGHAGRFVGGEREGIAVIAMAAIGASASG